ncbi:hypothetical protein N594_01746 [Streptococcus equi subsp. zooepidemicus Sz16]|nr:hypothetical protein N594_01746 [Streptococcus equi subsp. zooepidemicus Sz16]KIS10686.1 hypothetical protein AT48_01947 [Streptococcus equi subsp. zooepidemicus SzAM60]VTP85744.1 Uncharacterised protein [Streptococcus equi subsp. zooepidemicus]
MLFFKDRLTKFRTIGIINETLHYSGRDLSLGNIRHG